MAGEGDPVLLNLGMWHFDSKKSFQSEKGPNLLLFDTQSLHNYTKNISMIHVLDLRDFLWKI